MQRIASVLIILCLLAVSASAQVPQLINYQGNLADNAGDPVADGDYDFIFAVYDASAAGNLKWTETHNNVPVADGIFSVILGSTNAIDGDDFDDADRWLEVSVEGETITPRTRITALPYAMRIETVDGASGGTVEGDMVVTTSLQVGNSVKISDDHTIVTDADGETYDGELYIGHDPANPAAFSDVKVGIGTTDPEAKLEIIGDEPIVKLLAKGSAETSFEPLLKLHHQATDLYAVVEPVMTVYSEWFDQTTLQIFGTGAIQINAPGAKAEGEIRIDPSGPTYFHNADARFGLKTSDPHSTLHVGGSVAVGIREVSGDYMLGEDDCIVAVDPYVMSNITLPPAASSRGRIYTIKNVSTTAGVVYIHPVDSDTIDGAPGFYTLGTTYQYVTLVSIGSGWLVIGD